MLAIEERETAHTSLPETWVNWVRYPQRVRTRNLGWIGPGDVPGCMVHRTRADAERYWRAFVAKYPAWVEEKGLVYLGARREE